MTSYFDKLGLSPQERRLVVIVGIVVFIVINFWVIIPKFGDWGRYQQRIRDDSALRDRYNKEINRTSEYQTKLRELQKHGTQVATEEVALRLQQEVISQANLTGLGYGTIAPVNRSTTTTGKTNAFFDEVAVSVAVNTGEKELIDFLVRLADKDLLIRAKSMDIGPDPSQQRLQGNLTLVKSFQRKVPVRTPATAPPAAPGAPSGSPTPTPTPTATPATARPANVPGVRPTTAATTAPPATLPAPRPQSRQPGILTPGGTSGPTRVLPKPLN